MSEKRGLKTFGLIAASLFLLNVALRYMTVPVSLIPFLSVVSTLVYIGMPIIAIYYAASYDWKTKTAFAFLVPGALVHVCTVLLLQYALDEAGFATVLVQALGQSGILIWTLGLGVLLAIFIRDKNLMIPVAIFLIGFDMFLVFNPSAPTARLMREGSFNAQAVLMSVPQVKAEGDESGTIESLAYVGPADLLFSAAFFTLMFRFKMRTRRTLQWLIPVLTLYLAIVIFFGTEMIGPLSLSMLPAMVPIGLTVLFVNRKEFKLQSQEVMGVFIVSMMAVALASYGVYRAANQDTGPEQPAVPLSEGLSQETQEQPRLPGTGL